MVFKEEACMWFKNSESRHRLELICGLLNMCVPLELRFIRTCVDDLGKRDDILRDYDSKANSSQEFSQLGEILDERTRSKLIVYVALLEANNQTCSKLIFEKLTSSQEVSPIAFSDNDNSNINHIKEMLLIYTMVLHHPAFTFEEKRVIGEKFQALENHFVKSLPCAWTPNAKSHFSLQHCTQDDLSNMETCHDHISSPQAYEACDSGLSIGTEPEVELLSDNGPIVIQTSKDSRIAFIGNTTYESCSGSMGEHNNGINLSNKSSKHIPSIPRCAGNKNDLINLPQPPINATITSSINGTHGRDSINREASSSGSGESLDMYGESVTVPTTYIYNSSIYDHQNITGMPAMALGNNIMDMTPGYMCHQNGNCHFYRYPLLSNTLSSACVPRKPHHVSPLESSSSEEGRKALVTSKQQRVSLISPSSSPQSSPYASPPQSLSPSRAASPRENNLCSSFQSVSVSSVTGTTTSVVISKASPRPSSRHCSSSSSSGNGSHPSSPALASNAQAYRNKPNMTSKSSRYSNNRFNARQGGPLNAQENTISQQILNSPVPLTKVNTVCSYSKNKVNEEHKNKTSTDISLSIASSQISDRTLPSSASSTRIPIPDQALVVTNADCFEKNLCVTGVPPSNELSKIASSGSNTGNTVKKEILSDNDVTSTKPDNVNLDLTTEEKNVTYMNGVSVNNTAEGKLHSNLACGLNGFANPSSAHSVPVMTSVASGTCSHMHSTSSISHLQEDSNYDSRTQIHELSSLGNALSDNLDLNSECDLQPLKTATANFDEDGSKDCEVTNVDTSLVIPISSSTIVVLSTQSTSNLASGKTIVASSILKTSVSQTSSKCLPYQLKQQISSPGASQCPVSMGSKSSGITSLYATTTTNSTASMVPVVASNGTYPPFYSLPMIPGGNSPYLIQGGFPHPPHGPVRSPSQAYFMASPTSFVHGHPNHFMKGGRSHHMFPPPSNFNGSNVKSRTNGCGRSGSSSSSGSSGVGRKKTLTRGVTFPNKSLSSDSSPSSSQYSSPPQTPSPDHTKDVRRKAGKSHDPYQQEDVWEQADSKAPCMFNHPPHDDAPIFPPMNSHMMMPSNPIRQRYVQFPHPLGYVGYPPPPHPGMLRYSLTAPVAMGPRPPTPLNGEKSNRETTPSSHPLIGGTELSHKSMDYSNSTSRVPTSIHYNCNVPVSSHSSGASSNSPPVVPTPNADSSNVALVPPPVHSCSQNGGMHYNPPSYQMFAMSAGQYVGHLPGIFSSPSNTLPNSYVSPHSLPPNFPLPSMGNVINSELMYPGQYPVMGQTTPSISSCGSHNVMHPSNGPVYTPLYHTPPPATIPIPPPIKKPQTCYNCGRGGHRGSECKEASMDDLTKHTKLL